MLKCAQYIGVTGLSPCPVLRWSQIYALDLGIVIDTVGYAGFLASIKALVWFLGSLFLVLFFQVLRCLFVGTFERKQKLSSLPLH